jgi:hypothetical protein
MAGLHAVVGILEAREIVVWARELGWRAGALRVCQWNHDKKGGKDETSRLGLTVQRHMQARCYPRFGYKKMEIILCDVDATWRMLQKWLTVTWCW